MEQVRDPIGTVLFPCYICSYKLSEELSSALSGFECLRRYLIHCHRI